MNHDPIDGAQPVIVLAGRYIDRCRAKLSQDTVNRSIWPAVRAMTEFLGHLAINAVTPERVDAYETALYKGGYARNTIRHRLVIASSVFKYAVKLGVIADSPFRMVELPEQEHNGRNLDDVTLFAFFAALPPRFHAICKLILYTGLRRNEAVYLEWSEVAEDHIAILAHRSKSGRGRTVPIGRAVWDLLYWRGKGRLFNFNHDQLNRAVTRTWKAIGRGRIRVHDLRHTAYTRFIEKSRDSRAAMEIFGWASEKSMQPYEHMTPERLAPMTQIRYGI